MPFLQLNGIDVSVANDSAGYEPEVVGESGRAPDASLWVQRTAVKDGYRFATPPLTAQEALAVVGLVLGQGHVWNASAALGLYSSRGALVTSSGAAVVRNASFGKFDANSLQIADGTTCRTGVFYPTGTGRAEPTLSMHLSLDGVTWKHRAYRAAASQWYTDGTPTSAPTGVSVSYSATYGWQIVNASGAAIYVDDLWICPYDWPATWPGYVTAWSLPVGLAPRLKAFGDVIGRGVLTLPEFIGGGVRATPFQGYLGGSFQSNLHAVEFSLSEV